MTHKHPPQASALGSSDLATHFMECGALNTNLSMAHGERLLISDDLLSGKIKDMAAMSMAAIVARDGMVGRAAILPLSIAASQMKGKDRQKYEKLFALIEDTAFDDGVRDGAEALIAASFRQSQIRELVNELGGTVGPARQRYRSFLDIVKLLGEKRISNTLFLDEFTEFTRAIAGKLDFGIYSLCIDRLFSSPRIMQSVKFALMGEILKYPPLIRKELVTNLLAASTTTPDLISYAQQQLGRLLPREQLREVMLFTTLKRSWAAQKATRRAA